LLSDFHHVLRLLTFSLTARAPNSDEIKLLSDHDIQAERSVGVDPKKVVRHVHVSQKMVSIAEHGPVAFVMATLHEDFKKKFNAWVESV